MFRRFLSGLRSVGERVGLRRRKQVRAEPVELKWGA